MMLLMFSVILAITFSGIFDAATPRIQKADENTRKLEEMLNEIRDALNVLWIAGGLPSNKTLDETEFEDLVDRDLWIPSIVKSLELEFFDVFDAGSILSGANILVTCELHEHVEIYPHKIKIPGITVEDKEVKMLVQYRKGNVM